MTHHIDMVIDAQYGSTGKGLICGYLAKRERYDTVLCAFAPNAGHTYIDRARGIEVMTQQLPTAITSPTVQNVMIGPGAAIHAQTLKMEILRYADHLLGKRLMIHPQAAVVEDYHSDIEVADGRTRMGSTAKGVGEAYIERIRRHPANPNTVGARWRGSDLGRYVVTEEEYRSALAYAETILIEGAQGFSLSMYHGHYPYCTARDVTPWQIAADCGIPFKWASYIRPILTARTYPIRVNNRDGTSGPCYPDQVEIDWESIGVKPELTTVTKLPRRIFTFSKQQLLEALYHCGGYWDTRIFLNFVNYLKNDDEIRALISKIESPHALCLNKPTVTWIGMGPDDSDVRRIAGNKWDSKPMSIESEGGYVD